MALARSLVKRPKLLLLDEPLGALDKKLREQTQFELLGIQERLGVTFVVVTHDQEEAMTLATRIGVMNRGEIVQVGTPTDIYEYPALTLRRRLHRLGEHVRGPADRGRAGPRAHREPASSAARCTSTTASARRRRQRCGPRSARKRSTSTASGRPAQDNVVHGVVKEIAYMGDISIYLVQIDSGRMMRVSRPNIVRQADDRISWDETVYLSWHASSPIVLTQ